MKLKGISLPIEMMVIIAIAVLVLVVIGAFFIGGAGKLSTVDDLTAFGQGCQQWRATGCSGTVDGSGIIVKNYRPTGESSDQSLKLACERLSKLDSANSCKKACGCP
ncbi:MAG: hypothetical protein HZB65_04190 [Candidatus Aenigmarchaeota archaeon]|nr:hypothetical protein [Candidatus Aenigmarchaeota archaeon]